MKLRPRCRGVGYKQSKCHSRDNLFQEVNVAVLPKPHRPSTSARDHPQKYRKVCRSSFTPQFAKKTGKISKCSSVSERKSCVCFAGREAVRSVRYEGRLSSQSANSSGEQGKVTYVMVTAEGSAVGDRSRVTVVSLCSVVRQKWDQVIIMSGGFVYLL